MLRILLLLSVTASCVANEEEAASGGAAEANGKDPSAAVAKQLGVTFSQSAHFSDSVNAFGYTVWSKDKAPPKMVRYAATDNIFPNFDLYTNACQTKIKAGQVGKIEEGGFVYVKFNPVVQCELVWTRQSGSNVGKTHRVRGTVYY